VVRDRSLHPTPTTRHGRGGICNMVVQSLEAWLLVTEPKARSGVRGRGCHHGVAQGKGRGMEGRDNAWLNRVRCISFLIAQRPAPTPPARTTQQRERLAVGLRREPGLFVKSFWRVTRRCMRSCRSPESAWQIIAKAATSAEPGDLAKAVIYMT
jgi:hypothetical protein